MDLFFKNGYENEKEKRKNMFMYTGVLCAMSVHYMHAVTTQARRGHWIPSGWNFKTVGSCYVGARY